MDKNLQYLTNFFTFLFAIFYYKVVEKDYHCTLGTSITAVPVAIYGYIKTKDMPIIQNIFVMLGTWHFSHLIDCLYRHKDVSP